MTPDMREYAERVVSIEEAEYSFMPPVKIVISDKTGPKLTQSDVLHLRIPEAAELYRLLGDYLRGREEI